MSFKNQTKIKVADVSCNNKTITVFYKGDEEVVKNNCIAIVGTRQPTNEVKDLTEKIIDKLVKSYGEKLTIVSGCAYGVDTLALSYAQDQEISTIGVLPSGLLNPLPVNNVDLANNCTMLISQFGLHNKIVKGGPLARNEVIAGLCDCMVVPQINLKTGGTKNAINHAVNMGKKVFMPVLDGRNFNGNQRIIKQGLALPLNISGE